MSDPVARLNQALEGRYAIERELGEGGMAPAYPGIPNKHRSNLERDSGRLTGFCLRLPARSRMLTLV